MNWPIEKIRKEFPILRRKNNKPLVYLDNAATTHKPISVIESIKDFYESKNANIHRGLYSLSEISSYCYEQSRITIQNFINAAEKEEIIFTSGATESINLIAYSYGLTHLVPNDEILLTEMEHHANIIPWQIISKFTKSIIRYASIDNYGNLNIKDFKNLLNNKTKIVAITQASNVLGTINPIKNICMWAHKVGSVVVVDAAQSIVHNKIDVQKLDCDFLVFSGHKIYGPTGIGVLYSKRKYLEKMVPYKTGGNMINEVTKEKTIYADIPAKFEAGTPNIAGVIGLDSAIKYFNSLNYKLMKLYEKELQKKLCKKLKDIKDIKFLANPDKTIPICSFLIQNIHSNDISAIISNFGIALRSGHHCAMPLMQKLNITSSIRVSLAFYNTKKEIDIFIDSLKKTIKLLT